MTLRGTLLSAFLGLGAALGSVPAQAENDYGGFDIAGTPGARETAYSQVRGWDVVSAKVGSKFAYCAGQFNEGGTSWRLGYDGLQWQVAFPYQAPADWQGEYDVDGDRRFASGSAGGGWVFWWLGMEELDKIGRGQRLIVDVGRASIDHKLFGTAAVTLKIQECVERGGAAGVSSSKPVPPAGNGCPDDGPRLPGSGVCAGRASAYLQDFTEEAAIDPSRGKCEWVIKETPFIDNFLLYRALKCKGKSAEVDVQFGNHTHQITLVSGVYGEKDMLIAQLFNAEEQNPLDVILRNTVDSIENPMERAKCRVVPIPGRTDEYQVDDRTPAEAAATSGDGPRSACGPYGLNEGEAHYWKVAQGMVWFVSPSQDLYQSVDARSLTFIAPDGSGGWQQLQ